MMSGKRENSKMLQEVNSMERKLNEIYGKIADALNDVIPENWDRVYMYAELVEDVSEVFFYYYPSGSNEFIYCLDIPKLFEVSENEYDSLMDKLTDELYKLWYEFKNNGQEQWTNLTFILESSGKFKIDYDYTDLSNASPRKQHWIWKYKYLCVMPENEKGKRVIEEYIKNNQ
jgi:uncharacterized protein (TIGR01741 family)